MFKFRKHIHFLIYVTFDVNSAIQIRKVPSHFLVILMALYENEEKGKLHKLSVDINQIPVF